MSDWAAYGELENGTAFAAAVLVSHTGGSGVFYDLGAVLLDSDTPAGIATTFIGDRVQINSLTIQDGLVVLDLITSGPNDAMCCPTQHVLQTYGLEDGELVLLSSEVTGTVEP